MNKLLFILTVFIFYSCNSNKEARPPVITFKSFVKKPGAGNIDGEGTLTIKFTDNDGDIGLYEGDTIGSFQLDSTYYYNLLITYYEKQNGQYVKIDLPITNNARIPYLEGNGGLEGQIQTDLYFNNPFSIYDTIRYKIILIDRALNSSNEVYTNDIKVVK